VTNIPRLPPPPDADRFAFRRSLLDESSAAPDLNPVLRFLTPRLPALAAMLTSYPDIYRRLAAERSRSGSTPELEAEALALAGDMATVMQSLRSRPDVLEGMAQIEGLTPPPMVQADQLFCALMLMSGASGFEFSDDLLLDAEELGMLMSQPEVVDFVASIETAGD
jgi:hypothetical protein